MSPTFNSVQASGRLMDGQERILGVHVREHHAQIPPGFGAGAVNMRFREGVPETRLGVAHLTWLNNTTELGLGKFGAIYGVGQFLDAQDRIWNLIAADGQVYASLANNFPMALTLPIGVTVTEECSFEQLDDTLILMRGDDADPLQLSDINTGFVVVPDPPSGLGLSRIPRGRQALAVAGRLWIVTGPDEVWASDLFDHTAYAVANQFRVSDGVPDTLVAIALFNETSIIALKERSIWRLVNVAGTLADTDAVRITRRYGCVAARSVVDIGTDLMWWSQDGPASLTITQFNEVQAGQGEKKPMPGQNIDGLLKRVNARYRGKICAGFWDNKVYFAVPLDDAERLEPESATWVPQLPIKLVTVPGATYRLVFGTDTLSATNGTQTLPDGMTFTSAQPGYVLDFVAQAAFITVTGVSGGNDTNGLSLRRIYKGVNTAVLVLDTQLGAQESGGTWQGYDQADGIEPKQFFLSNWLGQDRLCFAGEDGWTCLYEHGYTDALPVPYTDIVLTGLPITLQSIRVNDGATIAVDSTGPDNDATHWRGVGSIAGAARKLFDDAVAGYGIGSAIQWSAPNTRAVLFPLSVVTGAAVTGVRFYTTNGVVPDVVTNVDSVVTQVTDQQIESSFTSRGLTTAERIRDKLGRKLVMVLETWNPLYDVYQVQDGVNEETQLVASEARSRTRYTKPFGRAPWNPTNTNNDFAEPYREDYSLPLDTVRPDTSLGFSLGDGLGVGLHQERRHDLSIGGRGRSPRTRIVNRQGRMRILAIGFEGRVDPGRMRRDT
jgi:hypothetical protein